MLQSSTFEFLTALKLNNDKVWFDANRKAYEVAKADFENFVTEVLIAIAPMDSVFATQKAKDCIFRIFRDVRFSKDKTLYKPHFSAFFTKGGKKVDCAGYYIHLEPGAIFLGGGLWMPGSELLKKVRQEIDYSFAEFVGILKEKSFQTMFPKIEGETLQRPPQGYDLTNPAIEYLKMKSFTIGYKMGDKEFKGKDSVQKLTAVFQTMSPLINFLNRAAFD